MKSTVRLKKIKKNPTCGVSFYSGCQCSYPDLRGRPCSSYNGDELTPEEDPMAMQPMEFHRASLAVQDIVDMAQKIVG